MFEVSPRPRPAPLTLMLAVMFLAGCAPNRTVMILAADNTVVEPDDAGVLLPQLENPYVVGGDEYDPVAGKVTYPTTKNVVYEPLRIYAGFRGAERAVFEQVYPRGTSRRVVSSFT